MRARSKKEHMVHRIAVATSVVVACIVFFFYLSGAFYIPNAGDVEEAMQVARFCKESLSAVGEGNAQATVYGAPGRNGSHLVVYRITDAMEQEEIAALVDQARRRNGWKDIEMLFYEEEMWGEEVGGVKHRGREKPLRTIYLND